VLTVQFVIAVLAAATVIWFLHTAWFPIVADAISHFPEQGEIRGGKLDWRGASPVLLSEGRFLALAVDLEHGGEARSPAHVQVEFGRNDVQARSLFGFVSVPYPADLAVGLNRIEAAPWWGAWAPALLGIVAGAVILGLMATWTFLSLAYCWVVWLIAFFANRQLSWSASWRLTGAALMPGALFMTTALGLYGLGIIDLLMLTIAAAAHFIFAWVYLVISPFSLPRLAEKPAANPFANAQDQAKADTETKPQSPEEKKV
jgi:hypothetical protein